MLGMILKWKTLFKFEKFVWLEQNIVSHVSEFLKWYHMSVTVLQHKKKKW